ncbi:MAG TPA: nucleoside-diphosphate sugar epimerase/dehydratase [Stellaceae bacterium]|jgi:O-antigen biosynthesis protein WbqV|nr:nucleoside-diphosphate sugar epimerase/dehydratase [Stellaceae bacterium]
MAALSFGIAFYLRLGDEALRYEPRLTLIHCLVFTGIAALVFLMTGLYRGIWRYASLPDLFSITRAATLTVLIFLPVTFALTRLESLPRSTLLINWLVLIALLGGPRLGYRLFKDRGLDHVLERSSGLPVVPVLLISTRDGADTFIRETLRDRNALYRVVGVLSDTRSRVGREIYGVPVLGTTDQLEAVVERLGRRGTRPQKLIVTAQGLDGAAMRGLLERADALAIPLARLPRATELRQGLPEPGVVEPIALEDLLGRSQAVLDREAMAKLVRGRRILVTGAGGTIGAELARQLAALDPAQLVLLDHSEYLLYSIDLELREHFPGLAIRPLLGSVRDRTRVDEVLAEERPEVLFHAAALKHVPMVELNPVEGVLTNVIGSRNVAEAARNHGVRLVVQISTDKAVNPTSVMGASKRLAEAACQALDLDEAERARRGPPRAGTRFVTVRFGNVLGSTGSVVPLFARQLAAGGPLTVTAPDVTRFFMTVREAVELVLEASATVALDAAEGDAEARGKIFVLDMGEPVRIVDLARQMIRLAGRVPDRDIQIEFTGLRPGEKLHEELFHDAEAAIPTKNPALRLAAPRTADYAVLARSLDELEEQARAANEARVVDLLQRLVPEYCREPVLPAPARLPHPTRASSH